MRLDFVCSEPAWRKAEKMTRFYPDPLQTQATSVVEQTPELTTEEGGTGGGTRDPKAELLFVRAAAVGVVGGFGSPHPCSVLSFELCQVLGELWLEDVGNANYCLLTAKRCIAR